jgi:hypothetical protein
MKDLARLNSILEVLGIDMWGDIMDSLQKENPCLFPIKIMSGIGVGPKKLI